MSCTFLIPQTIPLSFFSIDFYTTEKTYSFTVPVKKPVRYVFIIPKYLIMEDSNKGPIYWKWLTIVLFCLGSAPSGTRQARPHHQSLARGPLSEICQIISALSEICQIIRHTLSEICQIIRHTLRNMLNYQTHSQKYAKLADTLSEYAKLSDTLSEICQLIRYPFRNMPIYQTNSQKYVKLSDTLSEICQIIRHTLRNMLNYQTHSQKYAKLSVHSQKYAKLSVHSQKYAKLSDTLSEIC